MYYPFGWEMPGLKKEGDYRYGFNGMEKDDEIKGDGNSLDFGARIYDPRVGRWLSLDPAADEYPSLSPYNYVSNSPLVMIDPDGRNNTIYLVLLPSAKEKLSKEDVDEIISKTEAQLKSYGLKTQVKVFDHAESLDENNLDKTDSFVLLGSATEIKKALKENDYNYPDEKTSTQDDWDEFEGGKSNPEKGMIGGNIAIVDPEGAGEWGKDMRMDKTSSIAFLIVHAAGHKSGMNHAGKKAKYDAPVNADYTGFMNDGTTIYEYCNQSKSLRISNDEVYLIEHLTDPKRNTQTIGTMKAKYQPHEEMSTPKDNYKFNEELNKAEAAGNSITPVHR